MGPFRDIYVRYSDLESQFFLQMSSPYGAFRLENSDVHFLHTFRPKNKPGSGWIAKEMFQVKKKHFCVRRWRWRPPDTKSPDTKCLGAWSNKSAQKNFLFPPKKYGFQIFWNIILFIILGKQKKKNSGYFYRIKPWWNFFCNVFYDMIKGDLRKLSIFDIKNNFE